MRLTTGETLLIAVGGMGGRVGIGEGGVGGGFKGDGVGDFLFGVGIAGLIGMSRTCYGVKRFSPPR